MVWQERGFPELLMAELLCTLDLLLRTECVPAGQELCHTSVGTARSGRIGLKSKSPDGAGLVLPLFRGSPLRCGDPLWHCLGSSHLQVLLLAFSMELPPPLTLGQ